MFDKINGNTVGSATVGRPTNKIIGGIVAYLLLALGIYYFVVMPTQNETTPDYYNIMLKGCILGLIIYGIYDGTNLATINNFGLKEAIIDMIWGTFLSGLISILAVKISTLL